MKIRRTTTLLISMAGFAVGLLAQSGQTSNSGSSSADPRTIRVPAGNGKIVVLDGIFSKGEWEDALRTPISDRHEIYLKADSENLFVGLKSALPLGLMLSEIHITSDEKVFTKLHSSARLGEGSGAFPSDFRQSKFGVDNARDWEANVDVRDKVKEEEWIAQGRPRENYDDIFEIKDGKEYRISLKKLEGSRLRLIAGLRDSKGGVNFPQDATLENCENWPELVLPESIK